MAVKRFKPNLKVAQQVAANPTSGGFDNDWKWLYTKYPGEYRLRILPPNDEKGLVGIMTGKHWDLPTNDNDHPSRWGCIEKTHPDLDLECPICAVLRKYKDLGVNVEKWEPRVQAYFNAILKDAPEKYLEKEDIEVGDVVIFGHTAATYDWIWGAIADPDVGDITDPETGFDVKIERVHKGKDNVSYTRKIVPKAQPIADSDEAINKILEKAAKFEDIWKKPDDEYFEKTQEVANRLAHLLSSRVQRAGGVSVPGDEVSQLAGTAHATPATPTPPAPAAPAPAPPAAEAPVKVWYTDPSGNVFEGTEQDVRALIESGDDPETIQVMPHDQSAGWVTAKEWGI